MAHGDEVLSRAIGRLACSHERRRHELTAWVRGRVQGVGFRWFTRAKALAIGGLSGFALNLGRRPRPGRRRGPAGRLRAAARLAARGRHARAGRRRHRDLGHTARRSTTASRSAERPRRVSRSRSWPPGRRWQLPGAEMPGGCQERADRGRLPPVTDDLHAPGPRRRGSAARSAAARPGSPDDTGRDRVDRQTFW